MDYKYMEVTADRKTFNEIESTEIVKESAVDGTIYFFLPLIEFLNQVRISEAE